MPEHISRPTESHVPFETAKLDWLMEAAGLDVLVATSKHNVQYLLGGQRAIFFDYMDAMGLAATCRSWSIRRARRTRRPISATGWRPISARSRRSGCRRCSTERNGSVDAMQQAVEH